MKFTTSSGGRLTNRRSHQGASANDQVGLSSMCEADEVVTLSPRHPRAIELRSSDRAKKQSPCIAGGLILLVLLREYARGRDRHVIAPR